tara:strand:- start:4629 stop:5282 length:654 start_codon:yes stop_codon:yes gene_type:complete
MRTVIISIVLLFTTHALIAQTNNRSYNPIQFSGRVVIEKDGSIEPLPYTNIGVKNTPRGTSSSIDGFFSLVVLPGETVFFSRLGFAIEEYQIPSDHSENTHSKIIVMKQDTLLLPDIFIYPWPNRDFFKIEFLALEVDEELEEIAQENLSPEKLARLRQALPSDGREVSGIELRQLSQAYYYEGQGKPQNIFNPLSWKKFIDALKKGDFKKKKESGE